MWAFSAALGLAFGGLLTARASNYLLEVPEPGVYRLDYETLAAAGLEAEDGIPVGRLRLTLADRVVALHVEGGEGGVFSAGDGLTFFVPRLGFSARSYAGYLPLLLSVNADASESGEALVTSRTPAEGEVPSQKGQWWRELVLEKDEVRPAFPRGRFKPWEMWYWRQISNLDAEQCVIELPEVSSRAGEIRLTLALRGTTWLHHNPDGLKDHVLSIFLNGKRVRQEAWDGTFEHAVDLVLPEGSLALSEGNQLAFQVEKRRTQDGAFVGDVVCLNWIRLQIAEETPSVSGLHVFEHSSDRPEASGTMITIPPQVTAYGTDGSVIPSATVERRFRFSAGAVPDLWLISDGAKPEQVEQVRARPVPEFLQEDPRPDYVIICCPHLMEAISPLAEYHRGRGLKTAVVSVTEIYDAYYGGLPHPKAIRRFLRGAASGVRFVLLVGDATSAKATTPEEASKTIPTWYLPSRSALIAADNPYACLDDEDVYPDLALGRIPVRTSEELQAVIAKTMACAELLELGGREEKMLWISGSDRGFDSRVNQVIDWAKGEKLLDGFDHLQTKGIPLAENKKTKARIAERFGFGYAYGAFFGHGGRNWWRVGETDYAKGTDLYSRSDLRWLEDGAYLPVMFGLTCVSAPFDHPEQSSMGEALVLLPGKGSACFIGSSWRTPASPSTAGNFIDALAHSLTIGEAVMLAKSRMPRRELELYNLLGDPALPCRAP